jgi:transcriptional regulator with XRE-family HTH domain
MGHNKRYTAICGKKVKSLRPEGMSQEKLAIAAKLGHYRSIQRIERGTSTRVLPSTLNRLASALGVEEADLKPSEANCFRLIDEGAACRQCVYTCTDQSVDDALKIDEDIWHRSLAPLASDQRIDSTHIAEIADIAEAGIRLQTKTLRGHDLPKPRLIEIFSRWFSINPSTFALIRDYADIIGFTCVLPIKRSATENYLAGRISEWDLDHQHIVSLNYSGLDRCDDLLIQSITLGGRVYEKALKNGRRLKCNHALWATLFGQFVDLLSGPRPSLLIADGFGPGRKLLEKSGFVSQTSSELAVDRRPVFYFDFEHPKRMNNRQIKTSDRIVNSIDYIRSYKRI